MYKYVNVNVQQTTGTRFLTETLEMIGNPKLAYIYGLQNNDVQCSAVLHAVGNYHVYNITNKMDENHP
jgi:hypothetical protein